METLHTQFSQALTNIEVNEAKRQRAIAAHTQIQDVLSSDERLQAWGINTRLIGSYSRHTAISPGKDVDVFARLERLDTRSSPEAVYGQVEAVLVARYGSRATPQARSVKVDFPSAGGGGAGFAVDAVPAVRNGARWAIPNKDRRLWAHGSSHWVTTDPEHFGQLSSDLNNAIWSPVVHSQNAYKRIVKLLRQIRDVHLADRKPGGLYTEFATFDIWNARLVTGNEWGPLVQVTLEAVANRFGLVPTHPLLDPGLGTPVDPVLDNDTWLYASDKFRHLAVLARGALNSNRCQAAVKWRTILGDNDRGPVFPLPPGCDASGFARTGMGGLVAAGPREAQGFG